MAKKNDIDMDGASITTLTGAATGVYQTNTSGASSKRFAYIDTKDHYTEKGDNINRLFHDSLIVIGEEERAFIPALNAYIGPDKSLIDALTAKSSYSLVTSLNDMNREVYVVSTTSTDQTLTEINNENGQVIPLPEKLNIGIGITNYITYEYSDGNIYYSYTDNSKNTGRYVNYANACAYISDHKDSFRGSYVQLDNNKLIEGIWQTTNNIISYNVKYTQNYTDVQINKLYSEILGIEYIPISFDAEDSITEHVSGTYWNLLSSKTVVDNTSYVITTEPKYIKVSEKLAKSTDNPISYTKILSNKEISYNYTILSDVEISYNYTYYGSNLKDPTSTSSIITVPGKILLSTNTTASKNSDNKYIISYNVAVANGLQTLTLEIDSELYTHNDSSSTSLSNVTGAITTLSKVADILDQITDGDKDGGISLAYSIADNRIDIDTLNRQVQAIIDPSQSDDHGPYKINVVNSIKTPTAQATTNSNGELLTITASGNYFADQGVKGPNTPEAGNITLQLTYTLGVMQVVDANGDWKDPEGVYKQGLITSDLLSSYVSDATTYIFKHVHNSLNYKDNSYNGEQSTLNTLVFTNYVNQTNGKIAVGHNTFSIENPITYTDGNARGTALNIVQLNIDSDNNGDAKLKITAYTGTLQNAESDANEKLATVKDVYSYLMSMISWVDLSDLSSTTPAQ